MTRHPLTTARPARWSLRPRWSTSVARMGRAAPGVGSGGTRRSVSAGISGACAGPHRCWAPRDVAQRTGTGPPQHSGSAGSRAGQRDAAGRPHGTAQRPGLRRGDGPPPATVRQSDLGDPPQPNRSTHTIGRSGPRPQQPSPTSKPKPASRPVATYRRGRKSAQGLWEGAPIVPSAYSSAGRARRMRSRAHVV